MDKDKQEQLLNEVLERAGAFEETIRTNGWKFILARYQNGIAGFINELLSSDKPIQDFENQRQRLKGLKQVIGEIENDLATLEKYRQEQLDAKPNDNSSK